MSTGAKYYHSCINCGGINSDTRNQKGLPCEKCLPSEEENILEYLTQTHNLKDYANFLAFQNEYREFEKFFVSTVGKPMTGYQRLWARRLLLSKSFTLIAPTGLGKTTFGLVATLWLAKKRKKVALIFPTVSLVQQAQQRLLEFANRERLDVKILAYKSSMKKIEKEEFEKSFETDQFDILLVSSQFISKRKDDIAKKVFSLVFVDDVDAVLKSSKNIDTLLQMIGIDQNTIEKTLENLKKGNKAFESNLNSVNSSLSSGTLIVSSATARPQGLKPLLFRELLGFEIGRFTFSVRNITNIRIAEKSKEKLLKTIRVLSDGILLFVENEDEGKEITNFLENEGINVGKTWEDFEKSFELFKEGKLKILCGIYSYYGKLVRGIDLPLRIKYTIFWGTPSFRFSSDIEKAPRFVLERVFLDYLDEHPKLKSYFKNVEKLQAERLRDIAKKYIPLDRWADFVRKSFAHLKISENGQICFPDVFTYIQGSGRTSRMLGSTLTKGVSILFEEDNLLFESLRSRLMFLLDEEWKTEDEVKLEDLIKEVEISRIEALTNQKSSDLKSRLMIVESPTKAETISKFLEKASTRKYGRLSVYESVLPDGILLITASKGHVYDLDTKTGLYGVEISNGNFIPYYNSIKRCTSCFAQFTDEYSACPRCNSEKIDDKKEILKVLREIALEVDEVLVATDPDVEGEKISWDISQYLKPVNQNLRRIEMHEITKFGFENAIKNQRDFNTNLVKSQIVRRIEDRWVGFELSSKLQKNFQSFNLSAGRVQSTILGWIIEREKEYAKSQKEFTFLRLENGFGFETEGKVDPDKVFVQIKDELDKELDTLLPFNTPSLLSVASQRLNLGVQQIMEILQFLFEHGFITYHRTDSNRISLTGQNVAKLYLEKIGKKELFAGRSFGTEGAHEAIRPVKPISPAELKELSSERLANNLTANHIKVYELIFNRFLASQLKNPVVKFQKLTFRLDNQEIEKEMPVEVVEEGWLLFNPVQIFSRLETGVYDFAEKRSYKKHTVSLFTQATLIEEMKQKNIGRPSTYAKMVETLFKRGYVFEDKFRRIRSTALGRKVYSYLAQNYQDYVNEETTRELEKLMEVVETGEKDYQQVLRSLYKEFTEIISK
ncbi:reverse gyrase [Caldicellulosiruptor morganii]|uniref:Reverse gyrase n=1 Tax=Caldicellulosiruptor morganii TaxID=1387555 RepID=A0ABY7BKU5_9FIRM|nr:reverse gyrase [Caldicellulosiruptor morganii]WAM33110.1 reverse gyrase [Caldicellulosiruptor morganii]